MQGAQLSNILHSACVRARSRAVNKSYLIITSGSSFFFHACCKNFNCHRCQSQFIQRDKFPNFMSIICPLLHGWNHLRNIGNALIPDVSLCTWENNITVTKSCNFPFSFFRSLPPFLPSPSNHPICLSFSLAYFLELFFVLCIIFTNNKYQYNRYICVQVVHSFLKRLFTVQLHKRMNTCQRLIRA